jgi:hypothetical protein
VGTGNQLSSDHFERAVNDVDPDFRKSKLFLITALPAWKQTRAIPWFMASDQRKTIFFIPLILITTRWSIRDGLLRVKRILACNFA